MLVLVWRVMTITFMKTSSWTLLLLEVDCSVPILAITEVRTAMLELKVAPTVVWVQVLKRVLDESLSCFVDHH